MKNAASPMGRGVFRMGRTAMGVSALPELSAGVALLASGE
ncbi:hypothetical protein HMPREF3150_03262 [Pseudomonas aeruginosa]|nr:hypothetical protein HMPREF3150_03262 [Pseudomonas aeruginosa]